MSTLIEPTTKTRTTKKRRIVLRPNIQRAYVPTTALAQELTFDQEMMHVLLKDGRIISVPLSWFPLLADASVEQLAQYEIGGGGVSLHWPGLDEDLSVANLLAGADWESA